MEETINLDYSRVEIAVAARPQPMKLKKKGDSPLFYIQIILAMKKMKEGKKGTKKGDCPLFFAVPFFLPEG